MTDKFRQQVRILIKNGEGSIPHMYLDAVGKVTVGVGNMLPTATSACALPFVHESTGKNANEDDIRNEFLQIEKQEKNRIASYYRQFTTLVLPEQEIDLLLDSRLDQFEQGLKRHFPDYDNYPAEARTGMLDMAFNLGTWGLVNKFPSFTRAARAQDWLTCARECRRRQIQESRNEEVESLFRSCMKPDTGQPS